MATDTPTPPSQPPEYSFVVLYEKFCTTCGEPRHVSEQCARYKTIMCKYWLGKGCLNTNCPFAHGRWELRKPHKFKCAKVFQVAPKTYVVRGCHERNSHHFNACPKQGLIWPPAKTELPGLPETTTATTQN